MLAPDQPLPDSPPGDTRYSDTDPRFRRSSERELTVVRNGDKTPAERLAALMVLVYQVRCSLVHGNKNPDRPRDNELVSWGGFVLDLVVPSLENSMRSAAR